MRRCCMKLIEYANIHLNDEIRSSLLSQVCCFNDCCIRDSDALIYATDDCEDLCIKLVDDLKNFYIGTPRYLLSNLSGKNLIKVSAISIIIKDIRLIILHKNGRFERKSNGSEIYSLLGKTISLCNVQCSIPSNYYAEYSESELLGKLFYFMNPLLNTPLYEVRNYPQVGLTLFGKYRHKYNFLFLHGIAVYIERYSEFINWDSVLKKLATIPVTYQFIIFFRLFCDIYKYVPDELVRKYLRNALIDDNHEPSAEIFCCINRYCTSEDILNNCYIKLYRNLLTVENSNKTSFYYPERKDYLSFNLEYLTYTLDQHINTNPYGTTVFSGSEYDDSDELSVKWGVWQCDSYLCFLLKIHNKFMVKENSQDCLDKSNVVITIASSDNVSHKFTEIVVGSDFTSEFTEEGLLIPKVYDRVPDELSFDEFSHYKYKIENEDLCISLAVDFSYLHIPCDGKFGIDILTSCADNWSCYAGLKNRKILTWTGSKSLPRDIRSLALMKPFPNKIAKK